MYYRPSDLELWLRNTLWGEVIWEKRLPIATPLATSPLVLNVWMYERTTRISGLKAAAEKESKLGKMILDSIGMNPRSCLLIEEVKFAWARGPNGVNLALDEVKVLAVGRPYVIARV